ncbi:MAG: restriction endonuclease subunit S [Oscillospiraceae bacterium]|nr:restriction endonuclease subunit S [Oscillospiraceae bacterium]
MAKVKLKDIASFSKGSQINGDDLIENGNYDYLNGGINPSGKWNEYNVNANSITISEGGNSCGYVNYMSSPFWCGAHCYYLFDVKCNVKYLYYALKSQQERIMKLRSGACMPNIKKNDIGNFEFEFDERTDIQLEIAATLDKVTALIDMHKRQLKLLEELVKGRFVEMFGDPISNSMDWECCELGACLESIDNGKSYVCDSDCRTGNNPAILKLSAVTYGTYKPDENKAMIDEGLFDESAEVKDKDLLFTRKNTPELVGMSAYVFSTPPKLMMPDLIFRLNAKASCNKIYLWQLINHDLFRSCIQNIANGSAKSMSNISKERLSKLTIPIPPLALQQQFAAFVTQTDKSKSSIQQSLAKLETLKKSLMQEYFG